jgi:hypothetical protein
MASVSYWYRRRELKRGHHVHGDPCAKTRKWHYAASRTVPENARPTAKQLRKVSNPRTGTIPCVTTIPLSNWSNFTRPENSTIGRMHARGRWSWLSRHGTTHEREKRLSGRSASALRRTITDAGTPHGPGQCGPSPLVVPSRNRVMSATRSARRIWKRRRHSSKMGVRLATAKLQSCTDWAGAAAATAEQSRAGAAARSLSEVRGPAK